MLHKLKQSPVASSALLSLMRLPFPLVTWSLVGRQWGRFTFDEAHDILTMNENNCKKRTLKFSCFDCGFACFEMLLSCITLARKLELFPIRISHALQTPLNPECSHVYENEKVPTNGRAHRTFGASFWGSEMHQEKLDSKHHYTQSFCTSKAGNRQQNHLGAHNQGTTVTAGKQYLGGLGQRNTHERP